MSRVLPTIDELNRPFWKSCREHRLVVQRCTACERLRYPIAPLCGDCMGREWIWEEVTGSGSVYTFAVFRQVYNEAWRERIPYTVAVVELDEGPMMIGDLVGVAPEEVTVGMAVRVGFEAVTPEIHIPHFGAAY